MKCYFCQTELELDPHWLLQKGGPNWEFCKDRPSWDHCKKCEADYGVKTITCQDFDSGDLIYAHIYLDDRKFIHIPFPGRILGAGTTIWASGNNYHFRLHLKENYTNFGEPDDSNANDMAIIPGFPVTPANARDTVKRILISLKATEPQ